MAEHEPRRETAERLWLIPIIGIAIRIGVWIYCLFDIPFLVTHKLPDDALYYFTAARSFALGHGITFNGIHPTNGLHPLWLLVISPIWKFGLTGWNAIHSVLLLQSLIDGVVIWLIGNLVFNELRGRTYSNKLSAARTCQLLYACSPIVVITSINGLETTLAALFLLLWLTLYLDLSTASSLKRAVALGLCTGLLFLARTDSILILLPTLAIGMLRRSIRPTQLLIIAAAGLLIALPWFVWNIQTFGTILQSSAEAVPYFAMKKEFALYGSGMYLHLAGETVRNVVKPFVYSTLGLSILTIAVALRKRSALPARHLKLVQLLAGGILLLAVHSLLRGFVREWYVEQLIPLFLVGFGISIGFNCGRSEARPAGRYTLAILIVGIITMVSKPHFASQESVVQEGVPLVQQLTRSAKVASLNSGFYSYFATRRGSVVNLDGVVNPSVFPHIVHATLGKYLLEDSVDFVLDFKGDLGGYTGLIDHHFLDSYSLDTTIATGDTTNPLVLYRWAQTGSADTGIRK